MAVYTPNTQKHLVRIDSKKEWWESLYSPGEEVPVSGIYKCTDCGKEIASNKGDPFPPQNHHQHSPYKKIQWQLVVRADTSGDNCSAGK